PPTASSFSGPQSDSPGARCPRTTAPSGPCAPGSTPDPALGHVAVRMHHQGVDLQLTQYDERGWRATFYTTGMEHSPTSAIGTSWQRTPWQAVQQAARTALDGAERP